MTCTGRTGSEFSAPVKRNRRNERGISLSHGERTLSLGSGEAAS
jgi:hypothetical protein